MTLTYLKSFIAFSLLLISFTQIHAQNRDIPSPFYQYFLWYTGTIDDAPIHAKVAIHNNTYEIYYAYDDKKEWIHLINPKVTNATVTAEVALDGKGSKDFMELYMDDLHNITGVLKPATGEEKAIKLQVSLQKLPNSITNATIKNELTPLLLKSNKVTDSISVYYAERDSKKEFTRQVYSKLYPNANNQIIYVDINFDGYLDLVISEGIYIFKPQKQRFEVENTLGDFYPGVQYIGSYNTYVKTFSSSHWRTIVWFKAIDSKITLYEQEEYWEYSEEESLKTNVGTSENRIRYTDSINKKEGSYSKLELYLKEPTQLTPTEIVMKFMGNRKISIVEDAQLILYYDNSKKTCHHYINSKWKLMYTEINGVRIDP